MKNQLPAWCGRVNVLRQTDKIDSPLFEEVECLDEVFERTPQTVELPDHQRIIRPHIVEGGVQLRPVALRAAGFLRLDPRAARRLEGIEL